MTLQIMPLVLRLVLLLKLTILALHTVVRPAGLLQAEDVTFISKGLVLISDRELSQSKLKI
jgi:hypothetical protein